MRVEIADCAGFCFGVKRAIRIAKEALSATKAGQGKKNAAQVYSLGPIIHNNQVVDELLKEGLKPIKGLDELNDGIIVISSHGAGPEVFEKIKDKGLELVNATCPYVMSAQKIVKSLNKEGYSVLILGDRHHPEVESLIGCADGQAIVIKDKNELERIKPMPTRIGLVSQTTQSSKNYLKVISRVFKKGFSEIRIYNTICNDTEKRQESAARLAKDSEAMIIIGGRISANTKRLFEICSEICKNTYHVETAQELKEEWFEGKEQIGIASGASTPEWIINDVKDKILSIRGMYV